MKRIINCFFFMIFLSSCNFSGNVSFSNEEEEKTNAESVAAEFFMAVSQSDFERTLPLFSESFFALTSEEQMLENLKETKVKLGNFETFKLSDWKTLRVKGSGSKSEYLLVYDVKYSNFDAQEIFSMVKEGEKVKIVGYRINSDGFRY